ncbi:MAG: hypothetical protein ABW352_07360 [Polyangiales bacterium]
MGIRVSLFACLSFAAVAHATVLTDDIQWVSTEIPAGGVIVLEGQCTVGPPCTWPTRFHVIDEAGGVVPGHYERTGPADVDEWGVFVPDEPFAAGSKLTLRVTESGEQLDRAEVMVVEATAFDPASLTVSLRYQGMASRTSACCTEGELPGGGVCVRTGEQRRLYVSAKLVGAELAASSQLSFDLELYPVGAEPVSEFRRDLYERQSSLVVEREPASAYCYRVRAQPVRGGEIVEVLSECVPNRNTDVGLFEELTIEQANALLETCIVPGREVPDSGVATSEDAEVPALDAGVRAPSMRADGCQLTDNNHVESLTTAFVVLALAASGTKRRRRP